MSHCPHILAGRCLTLLIGAAAATACLPTTAGELAGVASRAVTAARRHAPPPVKFDPAVVPAGGAGCCTLDGRCGEVRQAGFHHGHAAGCRDGMCVPSCPVRPGHYGYYGTQWRRWPGQGVIQASAAEAATPVKPPKSAVPGVEEESPVPRDGVGAPEPPAAADEPQRVLPPLGEEPAEPLPPQPDDAADEDAAAAREPRGRDPESAATAAGPWSRLVAAASLPPGYEPPPQRVTESQ